MPAPKLPSTASCWFRADCELLDRPPLIFSAHSALTQRSSRLKAFLPGPNVCVYFFRIGLYPSAINRARIASASLMSMNGPTCT